MGISFWQLIIIILLFLLFTLPWLLVLFSAKVKGRQKFIWFVLSFFLGWLGYMIYYFIVVKKLPSPETEFIPRSENEDRVYPY